jgi:hypothetical protein
LGQFDVLHTEKFRILGVFGVPAGSPLKSIFEGPGMNVSCSGGTLKKIFCIIHESLWIAFVCIFLTSNRFNNMICEIFHENPREIRTFYKSHDVHDVR